MRAPHTKPSVSIDIIANDIAIAVIFAISGWMLKAWLSHKEKMRGLSISTATMASSDQRLARVEQAVESIAIEIERVSEGQRFVTNLLSERSQALVMPVARVEPS